MKIFAKLSLIIVCVLALSCHNEPVGSDINPELTIKKGSELYELMVRMSQSTDDPLDDISCILFIYPFKVITYDIDYNPIEETTINNNSSFIDFLENLEDDHSISLSYPIETTDETGTIVEINSNETLKESIENCKDEEIIKQCNAFFKTCSWLLPYREGQNNDYAGGFFTTSNDLLKLTYHNQTYQGAWTFLVNNDQIELNIHFPETDSIAPDWNVNFSVTTYDAEKMVIENGSEVYTLKNNCESEDPYEIGDTGPEDGIVAYKKGNFNNAWQYIEVQTEDLAPQEEWGCMEESVFVPDADAVGSGWMASVAIVNQHNDLPDYYDSPENCSAQNDGSVTARTALLQPSSSNWFLPSIQELEILYNTLHDNGTGNFANGLYWSATQVDEATVKALDFSTGTIVDIPKNQDNVNTRVIRYY